MNKLKTCFTLTYPGISSPRTLKFSVSFLTGLLIYYFLEKYNWNDEGTLSGLTFIGFVGIEETVRAQVTI